MDILRFWGWVVLVQERIVGYYVSQSGEMAEWSIAHPWKGCIRENVSGVRIPLSPRVQNSAFGAFFVRGERIKRGALYVGILKAFEVNSTKGRICPKGILVV